MFYREASTNTKDRKMLKSWSIKNFKPIVDSGELELAPVTVFAGRNSSGKSSLLQSILMIAQTLGSRLLDRPLLPNERLVQLGTYEDILSELSGSKELELELELEFEKEVEVQFDEEGELWIDNSPQIKSIRTNTIFQGNKQDIRNLSALDASRVQVSDFSINIDLYTGNGSAISKLNNVSFTFAKTSEEDDQVLQHAVSEKRGQYSYGGDQSKYIGTLKYSNSIVELAYRLTLSHFLPHRLISELTLSSFRERWLQRYVQELLNSSSRLPGDSDDFNVNLSLSHSGLLSINEYCQQSGITHGFSGNTVGDLARWYIPLQSQEKNKLDLNKLAEITAHDLLEQVLKHPVIDAPGLIMAQLAKQEAEESLRYAADKISHFFTSKLRYLGPSRADPGVIQQQFAPTSELDDVGIKGEYAAFVYHTSKNTLMDLYNPQTRQVENGVLQEALDAWIQYLKIAEHASTAEAGGIGITWQIVPKAGMKPRSLPEVGTGVSKLLPVLVMGLLAPANTLLIIEEPELDLHPYAQARLGDFFMGLAKCKKQCLIETHSENLVSQLRLHIVEAGGLEKSDCMVYFVDQDERGAARFKKIEISPNGNIMNWPDGFFDETMLQEDRITAASVRKRAQEARHGS